MPKNHSGREQSVGAVGKDTGTGGGFKGNKSYLPSKPCLACGREMTWRKKWAKNWDDVHYCSDACRAAKSRARES